MSKPVKKGTHYADIINFIMNNQQTSTTLALLSEGEKNCIQELYRMIDAKSGNIKIDLFWQRLRNCFDKDDSSDQTKVTLHAMVAFEKQASKYLSTINKRTQLTGKAGPDKRKHEDDNSDSISEPSAEDNRYVMNKRFKYIFSLMGQIIKNTNSQKENQGQGRQGDRDCGYSKEREPY